MTEIHRVVRAAALRLFLIDLLRTLAVTLTVAGVALLGAKVGEKLTPWSFRWDWLFAGGIGAAALGAIAWSAARRKRGVDVAREVDERAGLRESLSTALLVEGGEDGWSKNVVESARERARGVRLGEVAPVTLPRLWPAPAALALAMLAVWWLPRHDLTGALRRERERAEEQAQIRQVEMEIRAQEQQLEQALLQAGVAPEALRGEEGEAGKPDGPRTPEQLRREQVKRLTSLADKLREQAEGEQAQRLEAMRNAMRQLRTPGPGPLEEMSRRLARGEFAQAKEALEELARKLESGELSEQEAEQLRRQVEALREQMEQLAEQAEQQREALQQQLEQALQQTGMSAEQAQRLAEQLAQQIQQNPEAAQQIMQQALQQMQNLTPEQQQALQQLAQQMASQCQNAGQCQSMGQALGQMAQALGQSGAGGQMSPEAMQAMQQLAQQLSQAEMLQQQMQSLQAALAQCQGMMGGMGKKPGQNPGGWKAGFGFAGQGANDAPDADPSQYQAAQVKTRTENTGGPIIGSTLVYGAQVKGESTAAFAAAAEASSKAAAEAIDSMRVPREYQDAVRAYFGRLEAQAKGVEGGEENAASGEE